MAIYAAMTSPTYQFLLNMWVMHKITEPELQTMVTKGRITQEEYAAIIATPQTTE